MSTAVIRVPNMSSFAYIVLLSLCGIHFCRVLDAHRECDACIYLHRILLSTAARLFVSARVVSSVVRLCGCGLWHCGGKSFRTDAHNRWWTVCWQGDIDVTLADGRFQWWVKCRLRDSFFAHSTCVTFLFIVWALQSPVQMLRVQILYL